MTVAQQGFGEPGGTNETGLGERYELGEPPCFRLERRQSIVGRFGSFDRPDESGQLDETLEADGETPDESLAHPVRFPFEVANVERWHRFLTLPSGSGSGLVRASQPRTTGSHQHRG